MEPIYIAADSKGNLLGVGDIKDAVAYTDTLPNDFMETFGLGKYTMESGKIVPVSGWIAPAKATTLP